MKKLVLIICILLALPLPARAEWPVGTKTVMNGNSYLCPSFDVWLKVEQSWGGDGNLNRQCVVTVSGDKVTVLDAKHLRPYGAVKVSVMHLDPPGYKQITGYVPVWGVGNLTGDATDKQLRGINQSNKIGPDPYSSVNPDGTPKVEHIPAPEQTWGGLLGIN